MRRDLARREKHWLGWVLKALPLLLVACSEATTAASAVWVGPWMPAPKGERRTTIYYGPWQCTALWLRECSSRCTAQALRSLGCIWIADIKFDWRGVVGPVPVAAGSRLAVTHCCCNYATVDPEGPRKRWDRSRERFRKEWGNEFGEWPADATSRPWPGHHIQDLMHGGAAVSRDNVLPVPHEVHKVLNDEYVECYTPGSKWARPGPPRPYAD